MTAPEHARYEELVAGLALDALEPEDEHEVQTHLQTCPGCRAELAAHSETAAALAFGATDTALPPGMLEGLRRAVEQESPHAFAAPAEAVVVPLASRRQPRRAPALLAAAASVVLLVAGVVGAGLALRPAPDRADRLNAAVQALQVDGRSVPLRDPAQRVAAVAVVHDDRVDLVVDGLARNADDTSYVLWEVPEGGSPRALGVFDVDDDDVTVVRDLPLSSPGDVTAFAVTAEEGDTAPPTPRTTPVAVGPVGA